MLLLLFIALLLLIPFFTWLARRTFPTCTNLPPGSMGLPLLGETLHLISAYRSPNPEPFAQNRSKRYGRLFKTHILGKPTIFCTDPDINKFVLQNEGKHFASNYPGTMVKLLGKSSLLLTHGELHKRLYSLTWSFTNSAVLKDHLMADMEKLVCMNLQTWNQRVVFVQDEAKKITFDLSISQLLSASPGEWTEILRREYMQLIDGFFSVPIRLPGTTYSKALQARAAVASKLTEVVRERRKTGVSEQQDMLAALLKQDVGGELLSEQQIVDMLLSILVAGYETTSVIMTLAVKYLSENPQALQQLREEHLSVRRQKQPGGKLEWRDYKSMTFTQSVISETLRLGNIITGVFRKTLQDVNVKGYTVPKGWVVFTSFRAIHLDEDFYPNPKLFDPWRWKETSSNNNFGIHFTPFGGGPRFCPGYELARVQISVFLHHLVTKFSWEAAEEDKVVFFPTTRMVKRCPITLKPYNNEN